MDFTNTKYLKEGNSRQREVFHLLEEYSVFHKLKAFDPLLAGTIPIGIDTAESDLDIICYWKYPDEFTNHLISEFGNKTGFRITRKKIRSELSIIARFRLGSYEVEVFGQNRPSAEQEAFRHMLVEYEILKSGGENFRKAIIDLKKQGYKTEPAFAKLMDLKGDPYSELLKLRKK